MAIYLKKFETQAAYEAAQSGLILPNVSLTVDNNTVHYNPSSPVPPTPTETRVVAKYNVTSTSSPTQIGYEQYTSGFSAIEIDGVTQPSVVSAYTFNTTGEHTVKYTLTNPTTIGDMAFGECGSLTSIDIPDSVTSIGSGAFDSCRSLKNIAIPSGVTSIGNNAFIYCSGLTSCTIGSGVTSIGFGAFSDCSGLISITSNATTAPTIQKGTFKRINTNGTLTVPIGSSGYDVWMQNANYYLGLYGWTKVEQ